MGMQPCAYPFRRRHYLIDNIQETLFRLAPHVLERTLQDANETRRGREAIDHGEQQENHN